MARSAIEELGIGANATKLEGRAREIVEDRNVAVLSIPRKDGTIQSVMVWAHTEGDDLVVNGVEGHSWPANLRRAGTATLMSAASPFEWVAVTSRLELDTHEGARELIDLLARKYIGTEYPGLKEHEVRIKFVLRPERLTYVNTR